MYKYAFVWQCITVDYMYLAICFIFLCVSVACYTLLSRRCNVWSSGKHFRPKFLYAHAECAESRKMLEPDFDFHFRIREICFPYMFQCRSHTFTMKRAHPLRTNYVRVEHAGSLTTLYHSIEALHVCVCVVGGAAGSLTTHAPRVP